MLIYTFTWSPEGRVIHTGQYPDHRTAIAAFRLARPQHANFMTEVIIETTPVVHPGVELIVKAYEAGVAWANSLKVGDRFIGALPEAEVRYGKGETLSRCFMNGALDVLMYKILCTSADGSLTITRYEDAKGRVPAYTEASQ